jgi:hypothetical protein
LVQKHHTFALEIAGCELPRAVLLVGEPSTISAPAETTRSCSASGLSIAA